MQQNASDSAARLSEAEQSQSQILQDKQVSSTAQQHLDREPGRTLPESASFNSYLFLFWQNLEKQLQNIEAAKAALDTSLLQCQGDVTSLRADLENSRREKDESENRFKQQVLDRGLQLLGKRQCCNNC